MQRLHRRAAIVRTLLVGLAFVVAVSARAGVARAQSEFLEVPSTGEAGRIDSLERRLESIVAENRRLSQELHRLEEQLTLRTPGVPAPQAAAVITPLPPVTEPPRRESPADPFRVTYDRGFGIVPVNRYETPFSLRINSQNIFRYSGFARDAEFWIDSAGNENPIRNSSNFQIPRGRLVFSGIALLPKLSYLLNFDYNTVTSNPIGFRAYVLSYRFDRGLRLHVGQSKVPGSREWLESGFAPYEGPDRTMATTFFRPSLSQGIWISGEPIDRLYYQAMVSNGFNTLNLRPGQFDDRLCWSGSTWWEPWGKYGRGYADVENHEEPVVRLGTCFTFSTGEGSQSLSDAVENSLIRLSDGTLISQTGAFAPGVTLQSYDVSLSAVDVSFKYRGLSLSTECYAQNLSSLVGNGPLPVDSTQAYGGFLQGGYFVLPQKAELYARTSFVTGQYGSGSEWAGGLNWFFLPGQSNLRFTFDTAWLESSPADQSRTGYVAGQIGLLVRTQISVTY